MDSNEMASRRYRIERWIDRPDSLTGIVKKRWVALVTTRITGAVELRRFETKDSREKWLHYFVETDRLVMKRIAIH